MDSTKKLIKHSNYKCFVVHCGATRQDGVSFIKVPKADAGGDEGDFLSRLRARQRAMWVAALADVADMESPVANQFICSRHFIRGISARITDTANPDWVPSLFLDPAKGIVRAQPISDPPLSNTGCQSQKLIKMSNYEIYALIEGRVKYNHKFLNKRSRQNGWRFVQRNCTPLLDSFTVDELQLQWTDLRKVYEDYNGSQNSEGDESLPVEEWLLGKMFDAVAKVDAPSVEGLPDAISDLEDQLDDPEDYFDDAGLESSTLKASTTAPRRKFQQPLQSSRMVQSALMKPVAPGRNIVRSSKALQSGNPGLQPAAKPLPAEHTDFCRLCFTTEQLEPLCSGVIVVRDELLEKIYVSTGILVIARPKESIYICSPCSAQINNFSTFRQQACSNNRALLDQIARRNPVKVESIETPVRAAPPAVVRSPLTKVVLQSASKPRPLRAAPQPTRPMPILTRAPQPPTVIKRKIVLTRTVVKVPKPAEEAAIDIPEEEVKTEPYDDPLEGCGESGNALVMPKPLKLGADPPPSLKLRVETHPPESTKKESAATSGDGDEQESWKCWQCGQSFPFKFECAKHLLKVHGESVAGISARLELDELNTNMLEMMSVHSSKPSASKRPRLDTSDVMVIE